jgi:hypothetical protein
VLAELWAAVPSTRTVRPLRTKSNVVDAGEEAEEAAAGEAMAP